MVDRTSSQAQRGSRRGDQDWVEAHDNEVAALTRQLDEARRGKADAERRAASLETSLIRHAMALSDVLAQLRAGEEPDAVKICAASEPLPERDPAPQAAVAVIRIVPPPRRWLSRLLAAAERR